VFLIKILDEVEIDQIPDISIGVDCSFNKKKFAFATNADHDKYYQRLRKFGVRIVADSFPRLGDTIVTACDLP
jgi:hypothetical protein